MKKAEREMLAILRAEVRRRANEYGGAAKYVARLESMLIDADSIGLRNSIRLTKLAIKLGWVK